MFTTLPKTPQDLFNLTSDYFKLFPKNEKEVKAILEKVKTVLETETANSQDMWKTYQKALTGDASVNEIATANKKAQQLLISTRFAAILAIPGSIFMLPAIVEFAKTYDVDLIPASVSKEFKL